jgi:riboflavin synthase
MFSGIVEGLGAIRVRDEGRLGVAAPALTDGVRLGDSVAINGACLTVAEISGGGFIADVMPETLARTTLGALRAGDTVNIERALAFGDRIGGHMVTGHVDATGTVTALRDDGNARWATIDAPLDLLTMVAEKGCVAVDGISLTVVDVFATAFTVSLIPHTLENTTAGSWSVGSMVNLEVDLIARYVAGALAQDGGRRHPSGAQRDMEEAQR